MKKTTLTIYPDRVEGNVPEYLFGQFLEYMYDCIDPGVWAELLVSRGFENPDKEGKGVSEPWSIWGEDIICKIDTQRVYAPRQAQHIKKCGDGISGIQQKGLELDAQQIYSGYLWMCTQSAVKVKVRMLTDTDNILYETTFELLPDNWKQYKYEFKNEKAEYNVTIQYLLEGQGELWIDQTSLYPKDAIARIWPEVMKYILEIKPSIVRFPGGCAADCYEWKDGVGSRDKRPSKINRHWGGVEQNQFGTDEFMEFCRVIQCDPLICVNFGSSTPEEAADWVEYCNGSIDTYYGRMRAENGHPRPYGVKYWEIGNEVFGSWEIGHCDAEDYAQKYLKFADAMKKKDSSIQLLACGGDGGNSDQSWNKVVCQKLKGAFDALSLHFYAPLANSQFYDDAEMYRAVVAAPVKVEQILKSTLEIMKETECEVPLAITEWNCNYGEEDLSGREQTVEAAVSNAGLLNVFLRNCNYINMSNVSDLVNGWGGGIIRSQKGKAFGTATYHLIKMYRDMQPRQVVACEYNCDSYEVDPLGNVYQLDNVPYLDIVSCKDKTGRVVVFVVNRHYDEDIVLEIPEWKIVQVKSLEGSEVLTKNTIEEPNKVFVRTEQGSMDRIKLKPHTAYAVKLEK